MPYKSIKAAKEARFPVLKEKVALTISQINHLARIYDAIKAGGTADSPMATAWAKWKKTYTKQDDKWTLKEGVTGTSEAKPLDLVNESEWLPAAKVGQKIILTTPNGDKTRAYITKEALEMAPDLFKTLKPKTAVRIGHKTDVEDTEIIDQKFEDPFLYVKTNEKGEEILRDESATGWSIDAQVLEWNDNQITAMYVPGISSLRGEDTPACTPQMGCAAEGEDMAVPDKLGSTVSGATDTDNATKKPQGGGSKEMVEKEEPVFTEEQVRARLDAAVGEAKDIAENDKKAALADLEKTKNEEIETLETEGKTALDAKIAEVAALEKARNDSAMAALKEKLCMDDAAVKSLEGMPTQYIEAITALEIPLAHTEGGIATGSARDEQGKPEMVEEIGSYDAMKGEWKPTFREVSV